MSLRRLIALVLSAAIAIGLVWKWIDLRRNTQAFARARRAFLERRFEAAQAELARLAVRQPHEGSVLYWLGASEKVLGHTEEALAAWERVPPDAKDAPVARLSQGRLLLDLGRYARAEVSLMAAAADGETRPEANRLLGRLYWITGRRDAYVQLERQAAEGNLDPSETLRFLWSLDHDPDPTAGIELTLRKSIAESPDDDRAWLGLADLATRTGQLGEADTWLTRCEQARPRDLAVLSVRLIWALAAERTDELVRVAAELKPVELLPWRIAECQAYLAARRGDARAEVEALERQISNSPHAARAFERLVDLAARSSDRGQADTLRKRKAQFDTDRERYRVLINLPELKPNARELAALAGRIGRPFDGRLWWRFAARQDRSLASQAAQEMDRLAKAELSDFGKAARLVDLLGPAGPIAPERSPVTAPVALFRDEARERGLVFRFDNGLSQAHQLPETMSGGVAVLDFDGDGWLDVYALQGGSFPPAAGAVFGDRLFRNQGNGRFLDVTATSGLAQGTGGYGFGAAAGDYDNDGLTDLFVTRWRSYALYHNLGNGRFEDVTAAAGFKGNRNWPTSAAWADFDHDGDLDLYVCHYLDWDEQNPTKCFRPQTNELTYCDPRVFSALPDHVFRNDAGKFIDVTEQAGIRDENGRGLGVLAADLDDDGQLDLFVANDTTANYYWHGLGGFRFEERGLEAGLAGSATGGYLAGMGVAAADFDRDGLIDVAVTNFFGESTTLYHNHGSALFSDRSSVLGLAGATRGVLGFGLVAFDANRDGFVDLAQANGHVSDLRPSTPYPMPALLLLGGPDGKFHDASSRSGPDWVTLRLGRGLAVADFDNDGWLDLVMVAQNEPLVLLRNQGLQTDSNKAAAQNHFLTFLLEGKASGRDAVGAVVRVATDQGVRSGWRIGGGSYLSAQDPRIHFGLGTSSTALRVEVAWPSGRRDVFENLAVDRAYRLLETERLARPLEGFPKR